MFNYSRIRDNLIGFFSSISIVIGVGCVLLFIVDYGFDQNFENQVVIVKFFFWALLYYILWTFIHALLRVQTYFKNVRIINILFYLISITVASVFLGYIEPDGKLKFLNFIGEHPIFIQITVALYVLRTFSTLNYTFNSKSINPAQLFVLSFIGIILTGTFLLKLPNATYNGISFLDALFTSTSSVCVTGLIVVDTATYFTPIGKSIILGLIQLGGLGIMTFSIFFINYFKGFSSFTSQLMVKDLTSSNKLAEAMHTIRKIVGVTLLFEAIGAIVIYVNTDEKLFNSVTEKIFFSIFHAVSAFCNAGFSTMSDGLADFRFRYDYNFILIIGSLVVLGGLGFPILFSLQQSVKRFLRNIKRMIIYREPYKHAHRLVDTNVKIVIYTTFLLLFFGMLSYVFFEWDNSLKDHSVWGKIVVSLFGSITPRTAGFNLVDYDTLGFPTIMVVFLLMWIGASPGSTGGGIKTTTFAVGTLNILSLATGKPRIEIFGRKISNNSVRRAFATISLSLIMIGLGVFFIAIFDSDKDLKHVAFECFSAYSTVGLSLGITSDLSSYSKMVIIVLMFSGRVSMLTILYALIRKTEFLNYQYPKEDILIN